MFDRLYTLRDQIFDGGTTYPSGFGWHQIRDGSRIMASLVPAILDIMRRDIAGNPDSDLWGKVAFPRISAEPEQSSSILSLYEKLRRECLRH